MNNDRLISIKPKQEKFKRFVKFLWGGINTLCWLFIGTALAGFVAHLVFRALKFGWMLG